jgi:hypothetical protein
VLTRVRVDELQRRRGYGRVLVAAAVTLMPGASWSTTTIDRNDPVAQSFWAAVLFPGTLGEPQWCTDMQRAAGTLPDW